VRLSFTVELAVLSDFVNSRTATNPVSFPVEVLVDVESIVGNVKRGVLGAKPSRLFI
jgi:hypothetical protein